jgi:glycosyltransferase involved in cell wall biosynthesis
LHILLLTDEIWVGPRRDRPSDATGWRDLWGQDIQGENWPASRRPWNPFASDTILPRGLDPLRTLRLLFGQRKYDLIVPVFETGGVGAALLKRAGVLRRPLVLWDFSAGTDWRMKQFFQKILFPTVDGVLCLTNNQQRIAEELGARGRAVCVGYNIDTDFFSPRESSDGSYILAVGRDVSRDYETLIDAVRDCPLEVRIRTTEKLNIPADCIANISIEDNWLSYGDLRELYGKSKFVVLPLKNVLHPGGITSLAEAMSMGKAIICSASNGLADFLRPGENALVVPAGDRDAMRSAIKLLDTDAAERKRLGEGARKFAEKELSNTRFGERMRAALDRFSSRENAL